MRDYRECRVLAAKAMDELCDAKKQLRQVKAVVNFLIKQRPHNGTFFDEVGYMLQVWSGAKLTILDTDSVGACGASGAASSEGLICIVL